MPLGVSMPITGGSGLPQSSGRPRRSKPQRSPRMGKKHPAHRPWTVQLTSIYRPDREERIARAYELALPIIARSTQQPQEEENPNEALPPYRPLRSRL